MNGRDRELFLPRLLASLISLTIVGLGMMAVVTSHYYGRTTKLGGAEVSLDGPPAIAMGAAEVLLGLLPLAFWFRTKRPATAWAIACLLAAGAAFIVALRLQRGTS